MTTFHDTWEASRDAFKAAVTAHPHGNALASVEIQPGYTLDYAFTGDPESARLLVYSSGLHGIEGYAGSAVQRALLARGEDCAALWLHSLNPWGMAHYRRVNESNVDLNRNFLKPGDPFAADDADYLSLSALLNPTHIGPLDLFYPRALAQIARHGLATLRNAVARGQYSVPEGIFFGGARPEATVVALTSHIVPLLQGRERVVWTDLHTGRGAPRSVVGFLDGLPDADQRRRAAAAYGDLLHAWEPGSELGYEMRGGMLPELARRVGPAGFHALTVEFGTASDIAILRALRLENWLVHHGPEALRGKGAPSGHAARKAMRAAFYPDDAAWQRAVLGHVDRVHRSALQLRDAD